MNNFGIVLENVDLKKYNTYGIGGKSRYLVIPKSVDKLKELLQYLKDINMPWYVLGSGSNVILPDDDFSGVIIKLDQLNNYNVKNDIITVESGILLGNLVTKMLEDGYINYSPLMGIPGTLGGAIIGNAGAYGKTIFDDLISVTVIDEYGNCKTLKKDNINYQYRYTEFKNAKNIIVNAEIKGIKGNIIKAKEQIKENMQKRLATQPLEFKNAGSVFQNPINQSAGHIIENIGLKGFTIGGAKVSEKHANFIINYNNAKSCDIINLIELIKEKVKEKYNLELKLEQIIVSWDSNGIQNSKT